MTIKNKKKGKKETKQLNLFKHLDVFIEHLKGLEKAIGISMLISAKLLEKEQSRFDSFIKEKSKNYRKKNGIQSFKIHIEDQAEYKKLETELRHTRVSVKLIPRSIFVSMVSQFDLLISDLIRVVLQKNPEVISNQKSLIYEDAIKISSIKKLKSYFVEDEINSVLRENHSQHISWFNKRVKIGLDNYLSEEDWHFFIELTERRNSYVHNDGIVTQQYINVLSKNKIKSTVKVGDALRMSPEYLKKAHKCLYTIGVKISWLVFRKIETKKIKDIDYEFINLSADLIKEKDFEMSENLLKFFINTNKKSRDLEKKFFIINLALTMKLLNRKDEMQSILKDKDWSSSKPEFELAIDLMNSRFKKALELMEIIGKNSQIIKKDNYNTDPIYDELRKKPGFKKVYKKIFGEDFTSNESEI